jgi:acetyl-CoA carboxylase biotin carboxylase subunit
MQKKRPIRKILVANRGEIAVRIIRACKEMGIQTISVHSNGDVDSLHVKLADESVCIGPTAPKLSYLNTASLLSAAEITGADAIHPGYGFLSENSDFARICEQCDIVFIGPNSQVIEAMGSKVRAREIAKSAKVPMLPGSPGAVSNLEDLQYWAEKIGFPIILKASAGGGGRGIQVVHHGHALAQTFDRLRSEASAAFGNGDLYIEKYLERPRHVEVQLLCDQHKNYLHLGERDCTLQRRNQKIIEEAPCPVITEKTRKKMADAAVSLAKAVDYDSVGTVEFLLDPGSQEFYFMEMNTRIQVEHPVTEMITGVDLVRTMIEVAAGEKLPFQQKDVQLRGHSIECRINAEDPETFAPSPGKISHLHMPGGPGVRMDSFVYDQYVVSPHYDSLLGKLIIHDEDRESARKRAQRALGEFLVDGIRTNIDFHKKMLGSRVFAQNEYDTSFLTNKSLKSALDPFD